MENVLHVNKINQEAPVTNDIPLNLKVRGTKSESVTTDNKLEPSCRNIVVQEVICKHPIKLKSETHVKDCHVQSYEKISIKQESLHEELDIKNDDEAIQEILPNIPSGVKLFKCNICDYTCKQKRTLRNHLSSHTGEKPFKCNICDNSFGNRCLLTRHLTTHSEEKPYKCIFCDYSTKKKSNLDSHLRIHTGEKPFKCNICNYSSGRNSYLKIHLQTHTGEKPFKCRICGYRCRQESGLKIHFTTHQKEMQKL